MPHHGATAAVGSRRIRWAHASARTTRCGGRNRGVAQRGRGIEAMSIKALVFDTYGTVVDWRTSMLTELEALGAARRLSAKWTHFLADWKSCYRPGMDKVNRGEWPWRTVEEIYRRGLDEVLDRYGIRDLAEEERARLNLAWWRLRPWPDAVAGLTRLRSRYIISPLSNASFTGMVHLAKFARLPWDCIITAENAR